MKLSEAIKENTITLLDGYKSGKISITELLELEKEAIIDEEYEVAISIKQVLDYINFKK
jgi:hypothetical protein